MTALLSPIAIPGADLGWFWLIAGLLVAGGVVFSGWVYREITK